jgi:glycosyltransferase involved in cell wall biosynthesis
MGDLMPTCRDSVTADVVSIREATSSLAPQPKISVVIPALNEERNLPLVAARMPVGCIDEIVFVNGDSQDNTAAVARQLWPHGVHVHQTRRGKGNALACGFAAASGDIIVMIDADGSTDPAEIPRFISALLSGADFAKGSRFIPGGGSADITPLRYWGNKGLNELVNALFKTEYTDLCYGYNAFWRGCLNVMRLPDIESEAAQWGDGFEVETLINVRVATNGLRIAEVCSYEANRIHGVSNLNTFADGARVLRTIEHEYLRTREMSRRSRSALKRSGMVAGKNQFYGTIALLPNVSMMRGKRSHMRPVEHVARWSRWDKMLMRQLDEHLQRNEVT